MHAAVPLVPDGLVQQLQTGRGDHHLPTIRAPDQGFPLAIGPQTEDQKDHLLAIPWV